MSTPDSDPLGIALRNALNALAAARESQGLAAVYSLMGVQLTDVGRQQADKSQIWEVVGHYARAADIPDPVGSEWGEAVKSVVFESIAQLHRDGRKADEQAVKEAATGQIYVIMASRVQRKLGEALPKRPGIHY